MPGRQRIVDGGDTLACAAEIDGLGFALTMEHEGVVKTYIHDHQPCFGELRKYKSTHGDECTQPKDYRPGDLYTPFPEGTPIAVGFRFNHDRAGFINATSGQDSPWRRGINPESLVIEPDKKHILFVITDTDLDPTVTVQYVNMAKGLYQEPRIYDDLSLNENILYSIRMSNPGSGYYFSDYVNVKRFLDSDPYDLTGGTFQNRFDYNRKRLHEVFGNRYESVHIGSVNPANKTPRAFMDELIQKSLEYQPKEYKESVWS